LAFHNISLLLYNSMKCSVFALVHSISLRTDKWMLRAEVWCRSKLVTWARAALWSDGEKPTSSRTLRASLHIIHVTRWGYATKIPSTVQIRTWRGYVMRLGYKSGRAIMLWIICGDRI
jgi:hypothetical protein